MINLYTFVINININKLYIALLLHEAHPQSRPAVITIFSQVVSVRPVRPHFSQTRKAK